MEFSFTAPPLLFALEMAAAASLLLAAVPLLILELKAERARLRVIPVSLPSVDRS